MMIRVPEKVHEDIHHSKDVSTSYFEFMIELKAIMQDDTYVWIFKSDVSSYQRHQQLLDFYYNKVEIEIMPDLVNFEEAIIHTMQGYMVQRFDNTTVNSPAERYFYHPGHGLMYRENITKGTWTYLAEVFRWHDSKFIKLGKPEITEYILEA